MRKAIDFITSLKLTIICLAAAMVLIFAGTLAQVQHGINIVQERYFQGLFVWWPPDAHGFQFPVFPGGHLIGGVLLINLIAAHARRFRWGWSKLGIHLTHAGLIIMLAGGLLTDLFAVERRDPSLVKRADRRVGDIVTQKTKRKHSSSVCTAHPPRSMQG